LGHVDLISDPIEIKEEKMESLVKRVVQGSQAIDGAGVKLTRVLGLRTTIDFDPFLMLDSFDSFNPKDYVLGFPLHPHRGIETITYLISGMIEHQDSLGNKGVIQDGSAQWMTAGSGILHQEMPKPTLRMLGLQLWLNLPSKEKMTIPKYFDIAQNRIPVVEENGVLVRVISGEYKGVFGVTPHHIPATLYDIHLQKGSSFEMAVKDNQTEFVFLIQGDVSIANTIYKEKSAVLFGKGDFIRLSATPDQEARFIFAAAQPLHERIAWGGPIVMNTQEELQTAFSELSQGTFIKNR
jgi:hypothetical protein